MPQLWQQQRKQKLGTATHDVKHLLAEAKAIEQAYGIAVVTPAELLRILTN
jgi:coenzyme F420-reducing hydrogenase alpha subunit